MNLILTTGKKSFLVRVIQLMPLLLPSLVEASEQNIRLLTNDGEKSCSTVEIPDGIRKEFPNGKGYHVTIGENGCPVDIEISPNLILPQACHPDVWNTCFPYIGERFPKCRKRMKPKQLETF